MKKGKNKLNAGSEGEHGVPQRFSFKRIYVNAFRTGKKKGEILKLKLKSERVF